MKKCERALRFICENLDADVASPKCIEIRKHISECPECSAYRDSMKKTVMLYRCYTSGKIPPSVHAHLTQSLKNERINSGKKNTKRRS